VLLYLDFFADDLNLILFHYLLKDCFTVLKGWERNGITEKKNQNQQDTNFLGSEKKQIGGACHCDALRYSRFDTLCLLLKTALSAFEF
jgi:hypothetical protein